MQAYQIKMTALPGVSLIYDAILTGDYAAVLRAQAMASSGDTIEVWRDGRCIYRHERVGLGRGLGSLPPTPINLIKK